LYRGIDYVAVSTRVNSLSSGAKDSQVATYIY